MKTKIKKEDLKVGDEIYTGVRGDRKRKVSSISLGGQSADCSGWSIVVRQDGFWGADGATGYATKEDGIPAKFLITYDLLSSGDPVEYAGNLTQVSEIIETLLNNKDVVKDSIRVYTVSKVQKVGYKIILKE